MGYTRLWQGTRIKWTCRVDVVQVPQVQSKVPLPLRARHTLIGGFTSIRAGTQAFVSGRQLPFIQKVRLPLTIQYSDLTL